ncbi:MAG: hypothetical protein COB04_13030 [Gammaproteobacteria bacterium]|nr:MAG: hypothetical protein COB04_13030 [Gammaproteobacteria bacterium]
MALLGSRNSIITGPVPLSRRINTALLTVALFLTSNLYAAGSEFSTIQIIAGQTQVVTFPNVVKASIGQDSIANVSRIGTNEILLTGLGIGTTDLRLWNKSGKEVKYIIKVVRTWDDTATLIENVLRNVEGIVAVESGNTIFIEGRALRQEDWSLIKSLEKQLKEATNAGTVVFRVAAPLVDLKAMVMIDVKVIEVRRNNLKDLGIQWDSAAVGPIFEVFGEFTGAGNFDLGSSFLGLPETGSRLTSLINLALTSGAARLLAEPKLVTRNGSKAEFLSGGEIPIPQTDGLGNVNVTFRPYGVILKIEPFSDPDGYIAANIEIEISDIDTSVEILGIPGLITRKTISEVNMRSGQTLVISGMLNAQDSKALSKVPGLSRIPIFGELFKNRSFESRTNEIVVFVTPRLIDVESSANIDMLDYAHDLAKDVEDELKFDIFD